MYHLRFYRNATNDIWNNKRFKVSNGKENKSYCGHIQSIQITKNASGEEVYDDMVICYRVTDRCSIFTAMPPMKIATTMDSTWKTKKETINLSKNSNGHFRCELIGCTKNISANRRYSFRFAIRYSVLP
ncbi:hypothetical protein M514_04091 [Trichuris suis]|uniref:Uncharacterized protein n=1 Tax=Trichuris suis TaxID=68888 RepID=A0A085NFZ3_9BILA|nr:hypothetical protein M513_04091 [Trichuris suis]KFD68389.1 hypothetical protein M514_04091 [Trichuris suis]